MRSAENFSFVRKIGKSTKRNNERYKALSGEINFPVIYSYVEEKETLDIEYIPGLDMASYLIHHEIKPLENFLASTLEKLSEKSTIVNYKPIYTEKLLNIDESVFGISFDILIERLPQYLPAGRYLGDFTLDNIIYCTSRKKFFVIDPLTTEFNSYIFDLAKLNQDLRLGWFIRNKSLMLRSKLMKIEKHLRIRFSDEYSESQRDALLILMLLRIYPYCRSRFDKNFVLNGVKMLWR